MDKRRAARIRTPFYLAVDGIDAAPVLRQGNISASGLYVELPAPVGDAGSVEWLDLSSVDHVHKLHVMAHVIRTIAFNDISNGTGYGVALEFMPDSDSAEDELQAFVAYVLARKLSSAALRQVRPSSPPSIERLRASGRTAPTPVQTIEVDASWPFEEGESIEVLIRAPKSGNWVRCETKVERVHPITSRELPLFKNRLSVHATSEGQGGGIPLTENDLEDWMSKFLQAPERSTAESRGHLSGALSRIKLPAILSLLEMDRMTGELSLTSSTDDVVVFLEEGRVIDAMGRSANDARGILLNVFSWNDGSFRFEAKTIDRADVLATTTMALLLDLARETDERHYAAETAAASANESLSNESGVE